MTSSCGLWSCPGSHTVLSAHTVASIWKPLCSSCLTGTLSFQILAPCNSLCDPVPDSTLCSVHPVPNAYVAHSTHHIIRYALATPSLSPCQAFVFPVPWAPYIFPWSSHVCSLLIIQLSVQMSPSVRGLFRTANLNLFSYQSLSIPYNSCFHFFTALHFLYLKLSVFQLSIAAQQTTPSYLLKARTISLYFTILWVRYVGKPWLSDSMVSVASAEVTRCSACGWAGLKGLRWLHSNAWCPGWKDWNAGLSWDCRQKDLHMLTPAWWPCGVAGLLRGGTASLATRFQEAQVEIAKFHVI